MNNSVHFETLGCRLNQDETEGAGRAFIEAGFMSDLEPFTAQTPVQEEVVLGVVNTCTVTGKAEQKARRVIRLVLDKCPHAAVIVTGCYAEVDGMAIKQIDADRIAIVPGTKKYLLSSIAHQFSGAEHITAAQIESFVLQHKETAGNTVNGATGKLDAFTLYTPVFEKHSRASIKIEDGCNNACTFCRIHLARGRAVSLSVSDVLDRVQLLEQQGIAEVVFTGVNLSQYAGDLDSKESDGKVQKASFAQLLEVLLANTKHITFRISSFYPQSIDEALCKVIANERVRPSFHLSIQSGSDRILSLMKRPYTAAVVYRAVELLRAAKRNPFIACDLIAGFPGESEQDFALTQKLCKDVGFAWIHAFPYSPRPGTPAATMTPKIPERVKDERVAWLTECAVQGKIAYINSFKDMPLSAVVENSRSQRTVLAANTPDGALVSAQTNGAQKKVHVVTENFLHVECTGDGVVHAPGSVVQVCITKVLEQAIRTGKEIEAVGKL